MRVLLLRGRARANIDPETVTEDGIEIKRSYLRKLRQVYEYHLDAAERAGAAMEAEEIRQQLEHLPKEIAN